MKEEAGLRGRARWAEGWGAEDAGEDARNSGPLVAPPLDT